MSKKYVPSGYQIINISIPEGIGNGDSITPTTEDEKLLYNLLLKTNNNEIIKPILLNTRIYAEGNSQIIGFATVYGTRVVLYTGDGTYVSFDLDDINEKLILGLSF